MAIQFTVDEINQILQAYRHIFPRTPHESWSKLAIYLDFDRKRPWGCLTSNFHQITPDSIFKFAEMYRARIIPGNTDECGKILCDLAHQSGCGYSLGINPYTDKALLATYDEHTEKLVLLIGHDWYPIDDTDAGTKSPPMGRSTFLDGMKGEFFKYEKGLPAPAEFKHHRTGLLCMNLVPDFRPPGSFAEGAFPFSHKKLFNYDNCLEGIIDAIKCIDPRFSISHAVVWGRHAWEHMSKYLCNDEERKIGIEAASFRGDQGFEWRFEDIQLTLHPFMHPSRFSGQNMKKGYKEMWQRIII